jgi:hypothetical protein
MTQKKSGKHKIKVQAGAYEVVAIVQVEIELHDWAHDPQFSFPMGTSVGCAAGATYGAKYALDCARGYGFLGESFRVDFKEVKGGAIPSAEPAVAVAAALAVFEALEIKAVRAPKFDPLSKCAIFPL